MSRGGAGALSREAAAARVVQAHRETNNLLDTAAETVAALRQLAAQHDELFTACRLLRPSHDGGGGDGGGTSPCMALSPLGALALFSGLPPNSDAAATAVSSSASLALTAAPADASSSHSLCGGGGGGGAVGRTLAHYYADMEALLYQLSRVQKKVGDKTAAMRKCVAGSFEGSSCDAESAGLAAAVYALLAYNVRVSALLEEALLAVRTDAFHAPLPQHAHLCSGGDAGDATAAAAPGSGGLGDGGDGGPTGVYDFTPYSAHFNGKAAALFTSQLLQRHGRERQRYYHDSQRQRQDERHRPHTEAAAARAETVGRPSPKSPAVGTANAAAVVDYDALFDTIPALRFDEHVLATGSESGAAARVHTFVGALERLETMLKEQTEFYREACGCDGDDVVLLLASC